MSGWDGVRRTYLAIPALWRDIIVAVVVIVVLMGGLWTYTGQPIDQAPLVVVESGSMMHGDPPYGRIGTIDPGDLILVKNVPDDQRYRVVTLYGARSPTNDLNPGEGTRSGYGMDGDVVIYRQEFCPEGRETPIIHRAITWVEVEQVGGERRYSYHDQDGRWMVRQSSVHLPDILVNRDDSFTRSGWITKGDNPSTNRPADQNQICRGTLIAEDWLIGKARGEIPWIGLLKFMIQGNNWQVADQEGVCTVLNARAPCDTFNMLWITLGVLILIPLVWDLALRAKRRPDDEGHGTTPKRPQVVMPPPRRPPHDPETRGSQAAASQRPGRPLPARPKPRWVREAEESEGDAQEKRP